MPTNNLHRDNMFCVHRILCQTNRLVYAYFRDIKIGTRKERGTYVYVADGSKCSPPMKDRQRGLKAALVLDSQ